MAPPTAETTEAASTKQDEGIEKRIRQSLEEQAEDVGHDGRGHPYPASRDEETRAPTGWPMVGRCGWPRPSGSGRVAIKTRGQQSQRDGVTYIDNLLPSLFPAITASNMNGGTTQIVLLNEKQAEDAWRLPSDPGHLLFTGDQYFAQGSALTLERDGDPDFNFTISPPLSMSPSATAPLKVLNENSYTRSYRASLPVVEPIMTIHQIQKAGTVPPVQLGKLFSGRRHRVAMEPSSKEFALAAQWKVGIPQENWEGVANLFLAVNYDADVARLYSGKHLLDDNFYNGEVWRVGLDRFRRLIEQHGLKLDILPRPADAPVFLERRFRSPRVKSGQILQLRDIHLIPQYRLRLQLRSH